MIFWPPRSPPRNGAAARVLVASGDRDTFQLASDRTTILYPVRAGEMARIGPAEVRERYGVDPKQVPDFIALRGDPSDKLPGAPGVGRGRRRRAVAHSTARSKRRSRPAAFRRRPSELRLFRSIATMDRKAPLPRLREQKPTWDKAAALARDMGAAKACGADRRNGRERDIAGAVQATRAFIAASAGRRARAARPRSAPP